jgi:hypothetical protein
MLKEYCELDGGMDFAHEVEEADNERVYCSDLCKRSVQKKRSFKKQ